MRRLEQGGQMKLLDAHDLRLVDRVAILKRCDPLRTNLLILWAIPAGTSDR